MSVPFSRCNKSNLLDQIGCAETSVVSARLRPKPEITQNAKLNEQQIFEKQQRKPVDKTRYCLKFCKKREVNVISMLLMN
jgi:hypothetical protein